jgi:HK97 family phage prohead protease
MENQIIRTFSDIQLRDSADGTAEFVISEPRIDRHGTIIRADGWELENYQRNPIVLYNHNSHSDNPDNVIGTGEVYMEGDKLIGKVTFEPEDVNPLSAKIEKKVKRGTLRAVSVGFIPKKGHWGKKDLGEKEDVFYFDSQELLEFSIVDIPSLPSAVKKSIDTFIETTAPQVEPEPAPLQKSRLRTVKAKFFLTKNA